MKYKYPQQSDFMIFAEAVEGQEFDSSSVSRWFNRLVPKDDYIRCPGTRLIKHLYQLNGNHLRSTGFEAKMEKLRGLRGKSGKMTSNTAQKI